MTVVTNDIHDEMLQMVDDDLKSTLKDVSSQ